MKLTSLAIGCLALALCGLAAPAQENSPTMKQKAHRIALAVHGGAGTIERSKMTAEREQEYRAGIEHALRAGREILDRGGSSLEPNRTTMPSALSNRSSYGPRPDSSAAP